MSIKINLKQTEINNLMIDDSEISSLLLDIPEEDREEVIRKALKIGLLALKGSSTIEKVDYIEKEFHKFKTNVEEMMRETNENIKTNLGDVFSDKGLLKLALDGYLGEGGKMKDLFDENKKDSAIAKFADIMSRHFDGDGSVIKKMLDSNNPSSPLYMLKKELLDSLKNIETSINVKTATDEAESKGTRKGFDYESLVANEVDKIARILEDNVYKVGLNQGDSIKSKAGDILSKVNPKNANGREITIVFEAKDRTLGLGNTLTELNSAKANRSADAAVAVFSSVNNSPTECGVFRVYDKERIVCVLDKETMDPTMLQAAYKVAIALAFVRRVKEERQEDTIDTDRIMSNVNSIREKIKTFSTIKSNLTSVNTFIGKVQTDLDILKTDLIGLTSDIEIAMVSDKGQGVNLPVSESIKPTTKDILS